MPWGPFADELDRRFKNCEALPTVEEEAKYLEGWARSQNLKATGDKDTVAIHFPRIRERIKKRLGGTGGYKSTRKYHRDERGCP